MISTFLIENYALYRLILLVGAIVCVILAGILVWAGGKGRRIALAIAALSTLAALALTLSPDKYPLPAVMCALDPVYLYWDTSNVLLFALPALFAAIATRRPILVLAGGVVLSALIELVQAITPILGRRCDPSDWLANSIGTLAGVAVAVLLALIVRWIQGRRSRRVDSGE